MPLQATSGTASYDAFGGGTAAVPNYIEDVFSTWLYTGNGSTQTITNGIDLSTKGGLVWSKSRTLASSHVFIDTARGKDYNLASNSTAAQVNDTNAITAFNTTGYDIAGLSRINSSGDTFASWTFRKQPKFFDVVTYTGTGANRTIAHALGSTPGCVIVKRTDTTGNWQVYHNSLTSAAYSIQLNLTNAQASATTIWNSTAPTSTVFSVGTDATVNASGGTYVAYIFAHNAGGFGLTGTDNVISCGSFTTDASGSVTVNLGYEPQWLLVKNTQLTENWVELDNMRGWSFASQQRLFPNLSNAEQSLAGNYGTPTATGFNFVNGLGNSNTYIYIAIRRGPMKVPTSGTSVFGPIQYTGTGSQQTLTGISFSPDYVHTKSQTGFGASYLADRLRSPGYRIQTETTAAESNRSAGGILSFNNNGFTVGTYSDVNPSGNGQIAWCFRRAPNFFDVVCYTGTGAVTTQTHNLGVVPELMIVKSRSLGTESWTVWNTTIASLNAANFLWLNSTSNIVTNSGRFNSTAPTASVFTVGSDTSTNGSGSTYVAYLFATCAGVSKVGSYTGNGSSQTINCGFTGGARFVLIKRTDSTGDWYVWDTARGIVSAEDPHLSLNTTAAEVTTDDTIDTDSTGFIVNQVAATNVNVTSATYIFLAIA